MTNLDNAVIPTDQPPRAAVQTGCDPEPSRPSWRVPVLAWVVSRLLVISVAIIGSEWLGAPNFGTDTSVPKPLALLGAWDTSWYLDLARNGYQQSTFDVGVRFTNFAFFPLLPTIMRLGIWTSTNPFFWGLIVSNFAFLGGLWAFHRISEDRRGCRFANRATWVLALSPPAVYASLAYTDAILLGLAAAGALAAIRGRWYLAGLSGFAAALDRPQGILVAMLVVLIVLSTNGAPRSARVRNAAIAGIPAVLAIGGFLTWMQLERGAWDLPLRAQQAWTPSSPGVAAVRGLAHQAYAIASFPFTPTHPELYEICGACGDLSWTGPLRDLLYTVVAAVLVVALWRFEQSWRSPWLIFAALAVLIPLAAGSMAGITRFTLLAFPLVWPVTAWIEHRERVRAPVAVGLGLVVVVLLTVQLHFIFP
jgi:hypothetical protein